MDKAKAAKKEVSQRTCFSYSCCFAPICGRHAACDLHISFRLASRYVLLTPCSSFSEGGREEEARGTYQVLRAQGIEAADKEQRSRKAAEGSGVRHQWYVRVPACFLSCTHSSLQCVFIAFLLYRCTRRDASPSQLLMLPLAVFATASMPVCLRSVQASKISPWPVDVLRCLIFTMA